MIISAFMPSIIMLGNQISVCVCVCVCVDQNDIWHNIKLHVGVKNTSAKEKIGCS